MQKRLMRDIRQSKSGPAFKWRRTLNRLTTVGHMVVIAAILAGCALFTPLPETASRYDRMNALPRFDMPVERQVVIHWSAQSVPFIEAQTDADAAFALGLVHAHLRLGQMEIMRRVSQGRLAEVAGPFGSIKQLEQALRIIDLGKTSRQVYAQMDERTRQWLDRYVEGINYYLGHAKELPHEFKVLHMKREPWEAPELLTIGRLASVDPNWTIWLRLLRLRDREDWPQIWASVVKEGTASVTSFAYKEDKAANRFARLLTIAAKWGSNSMAVSREKSATGSAIIASDPHLGVGIPNIWLLAGLKSPSYHMVGLMIPGMPFVAVGRNPDIAWGGTHLRSNGSDLFDVSGLPADQITTREIKSKVRWWFDRKIKVRETPYGPIISDLAMVPAREGETIALKWVGHLPSDEVTAMLALNRATDWRGFRRALEGFSISAQNFVYADAQGNIGQVTATYLPSHSLTPPDDLVQPLANARAWDKMVNATGLPSVYNPQEGFVASANNKPAEADVPIGYFFSGDDRVLRMRQKLGAPGLRTLAEMKELQVDTYMRSAALLRDALVERAAMIADLPAPAKSTLDLLAAWDGRYDASKPGPVALQAVTVRLMPVLLSEAERVVMETGGNALADYAAIVRQEPPESLNARLVWALSEAQDTLAEYPTWGELHPLKLRHHLAMAPVLEKRYSFGVLPWPGSTDTIWKGDHAMAIDESLTRYGAQARHISDMSDLDANWFVLLGGNDGWLNAENFLDQTRLFRDGQMVQVPLRLSTVKETFADKTILTP